MRKIDPQVRALDPEFHSKVFLGENSVGIKRCLTAPAQLPNEGVPVPVPSPPAP